MEVLRTPDECFDGLLDWEFDPHFCEVTAADGTNLRMHFVDEGPSDAAPVLLMHGNPSWSYLYRHMIPGLVDQGHRVLAIDLVGMGRSDKPAATSDYTLDAHVDWVCQLLEKLDLNRITLFCQDWGGIIGLVVAMELPDRFDRIIASNTGIPVGEGENQFMRDWIAFSQSVDVLPVGALLQSGSTRELSAAEVAAYDAPFPDGSFQAAAKQFPLLIPVQPDNPGVPRCRVTWERLANWDKPFLTIFGTEDAVAYKPGSHRRFQREVPGAQGQPHLEIEGANHFIQEDASEELVAAIDAFVKATAP